MEFKELADTFMNEFHLEPYSAENCERLSQLVYRYLWEHPGFREHKKNVIKFWEKVGDGWEEASKITTQ